ncbi:MAG: hypothetical protein R3A80_11195 [Bdellovibrionota bacterium]
MNKKRRWECTAANKEYNAIDNEEMKARLEELWMILLNVRSQQLRQNTSVHVLSDQERKTA